MDVRIFLPATCLLVAAATPAPAVGQTNVDVRLDSFHFSPEPIRLVAGQPVVITFTNVSDATHDFKAPAFFSASGAARSVPKGVIVLKGGEKVSVTLLPRKGSYKVKCSRFGHALMGMTSTIIVE